MFLYELTPEKDEDKSIWILLYKAFHSVDERGLPLIPLGTGRRVKDAGFWCDFFDETTESNDKGEFWLGKESKKLVSDTQHKMMNAYWTKYQEVLMHPAMAKHAAKVDTFLTDVRELTQEEQDAMIDAVIEEDAETT